MDVNSSIIAVVALLASFGMPILITAIVLWHIMRKTRLNHDTVLKLADKGVPIPPGLIPQEQPRQPSSDFRTGAVLLGAGAGLSLLLWEIHAPISVGAIPALMGLGYIVTWMIEKQERRQEQKL
jgi:hypothetical protein